MTTTAPRPAAPAPVDRRPTGADRLRAAVALGPLVVRRRSRDDAGLLILTALLLATTVLLAVAVPRLLDRTADAAVRAVVADAGLRGDVVIELPTRTPRTDGSRNDEEAAIVANAAASVRDRVTDAIRTGTRQPVTAVATSTSTTSVAGEGQLVRLVHVGSAQLGSGALVRWVAGSAPDAAPLVAPPAPADAAPTAPDGSADAAPTAPDGSVDAVLPGATRPLVPRPSEIRVGLAATTAERLGLDVGTRFELPVPTSGGQTAVVTGLYAPVDPTADEWRTLDDLLQPMPAPVAADAEHRVAYLVSDASLPDLTAAVQPAAVTRTVRLVARPAGFDESRAALVADDLARLSAWSESLATPDGTPVVSTTLHGVLAEARTQLSAARTQASVLLVGVATVGALALVLASRLLVGRREALLLAERARGASVASVVVRALLESVPVALLAAAVGAGAAVLLVPGEESRWGVPGAVTAVAVLAPAVATAVLVRRAWTGARQPANRSDRDRLARQRGLRRTTAELALAALAAAAVVSVRGRGLVRTGSGEIDLLLSAAPALLAAAATVLAARLLPPVLRGLSRVATRRRGLVGVVAAARAARASGTLVPLLTLTTAVALVVFAGTVGVTVRTGQDVAADDVVGATVRVDGPVTSEQVDAMRDAPGVTAVAAAAEQPGRSFGQSTGVKARLLIVDTVDLARILQARGEPSDAWAALASPSSDGLPTLLTPELARTAQLVDPSFLAGGDFVPLDAQGTVASVPRVAPEERRATRSAADSPLGEAAFVVDRTRYAQATDAEVRLSAVWVDGPGARAAVTAAGLDVEGGVTVTVRDQWLESMRASPVGAGLTQLLVASAAVLALYAAVALVLTVVATSRERGRTLSALRTQGLDARTARALTFGELAPLAVTAVLAGTVIGIAVPWVLADALGLDRLTGAPGTAELRLSWVPVVAAAAVVTLSLVVAVLVESAVRRRDRLGDVLRVGER